MLIDTHCHLHFDVFDGDRNDVVRRAAEAGVGHLVLIGTDLDTSRQAMAMTGNIPGTSSTVGWHPHEAAALDDAAFDALSGLAKDESVVGIGEIGLDYFRDLSPRDTQQAVFRRMLGLARAAQLPVVIHCRDAQDDLLEILTEEWGAARAGVMHCFSGGSEFVERCVALGFYISFACNALYKTAGMLRDAAAAVPADRLLVETDAPYLPEPDKRGSRNEPASVAAVAAGLASVRGVSVEELQTLTTQNAMRVFGNRLKMKLQATSDKR